MSGKFQNKYRIPSARLASWDYSNNGAYFITICTAHREHYFGKIINGRMHLSKQGETANHCWLQIPYHFSFAILNAFIVMPNHFHGIVVIDKPGNEPGLIGVETLHATSLLREPPNKNKQMTDISPKPNSLPAIIRSFKSAVTKYCNDNRLPFGWQTRFHDHIIRNNDEFERIRNYINNNPVNWNEDKFFK